MQTRFALRFAIAVAVLASLFSSCQRIEEPQVQPQQQGDAELISFLIESGFDKDKIEVVGDYFRLDADMAIAKESVAQSLKACNAASSSPSGRTEQYVFSGPGLNSNLVSWEKAGNITYRINSSLLGIAENKWIYAIKEGIFELNTLAAAEGINLVISLAPAGQPADIIFTTDAQGPECFRNLGELAAAALLPAGNGNPGSAISINTGPDAPMGNVYGFINTVKHELGHTLGFRHTNWQESGEPRTTTACGGVAANAVLIPGTPTTDPASLMNAAYSGNEPQPFSDNDILALQKLYPDELAPPQLDIYQNANVGGSYMLKVANIDNEPKAAYIRIYQKSPSGNFERVGDWQFNPVTGSLGFSIPSGYSYKAKFLNFKSDKESAFSSTVVVP